MVSPIKVINSMEKGLFYSVRTFFFIDIMHICISKVWVYMAGVLGMEYNTSFLKNYSIDTNKYFFFADTMKFNVYM